MRARATTRGFKCHSCLREWKDTYWLLDEDMRASHNFGAGPCLNCTNRKVFTSGNLDLPPTECSFKISCTCATPHVEIIEPVYVSDGSPYYAQCRASQRAVYYELPDGTVCAPETNSYTDPGALAAISRGGVRREIHSVREMARLHREWQPADFDPSAPGSSGWGQNHNLVLDFDRSSRIAGANHPLRQEVNKQLGPQHNPFAPQTTEDSGSVFRILQDPRAYEKAREDYQRRTRG